MVRRCILAKSPYMRKDLSFQMNSESEESGSEKELRADKMVRCSFSLSMNFSGRFL